MSVEYPRFTDKSCYPGTNPGEVDYVHCLRPPMECSLLEYVQSEDFVQWIADCKPHQVMYYHGGSTFFLMMQNDLANPFNEETLYPCPDLNRVLKK